jgi:hypothetical protein
MKNFVFVAALVASAGLANAAIGDSAYAIGGDVIVTIGPSDAGYTSDLYLVSPGATQYIGSNRDLGTMVNLGSFSTGVELIFKIHVRNTGDDFYTGSGALNADNIPHADVQSLSPTLTQIQFEDIFGGGDHDYNDMTFNFSGVVPAPASLGFFGVAAIGMGRRRR